MINHFKGFSCAVLSALLLLTGCTESVPPTYTLRTHTAEMPFSLHPHTRAAEADFAASFTERGFVSPTDEDSWQFEMAEEITDITASFSDRDKWAIQEEAGRVFRIVLRQDARWEDGTPITADTYVDSMKLLLDPQSRNSRASLYTEGPAAILQAETYFSGGAQIYSPCVPPYGEDKLADYSFDFTEEDVYLHLTTRGMTLTDKYSIRDIYEAGYIDPALYARVEAQADIYGYIKLTEDTEEDIRALAERVMVFFGLRLVDDYFKEMLFFRTGETRESLPFSRVGIFKSGAYELTYITAEKISREEFLAGMTANWIVHPDGNGDSMEEHPSYGPYSLSKVKKDRLIYTRNTKWYGWNKEDTASFCGGAATLECLILDTEEADELFERGKLEIYTDPRSGECRYSARLEKVRERGYVRFLYDDAAWAKYVRDRGGYPYR